jgi:UDPglucose 6-dehydrogenase
MNVAIIGTGYVGLVVGSCLAESGNDVICVDVDADKIERLKKGLVPIYEPGLPELIERNTREGRLTFTTDLDDAVKRSFVLFVAVGTPTSVDGRADLQAVLEVARQIGPSIDRYKIVVMKSTVPVGTTERVRDLIGQQTRAPFDVISNPEFLKEGAAVEDFMKPDRVIIGADDLRAGEVIRALYAPFVRTGSPTFLMSVRTAEMTKYACNAFLATRITFMNDLANLCEQVGADVDMIRKGMGADSRIGPAFLFPGMGYGGSCLPKDVRALLRTAEDNAYPLKIMQAVDEVNSRQAARFVEKIRAHFSADLKDRRIAIWGLSFKPRTNDIREAPALKVIDGLLADGARVAAYDPEAIEEARAMFGSRVEFASNNYACLEGADALVLATEWQVFRTPNFDRMKSLMKHPVVFDGRNIYDPAGLRELGFTYYGIGRP